MKANKKNRPNRYKKSRTPDKETRKSPLFSIDIYLKFIMIIAFFSVMSLASIFIYDFICQSRMLNIKQIYLSGNLQTSQEEILAVAGLSQDQNILQVNLFAAEKKIAAHPWIAAASAKRNLAREVHISIVEEKPLAIVKIENLADVLINTHGIPFKEYNPSQDRINDLPVITGLDLRKNEYQYMFDGPLFNAIMDFLNSDHLRPHARTINADNNTGISIETIDIYNSSPERKKTGVQVKLGFNQYREKLTKAKKICDYIEQNYPDRAINAIDIFDINKVFIQTTMGQMLENG